MSKLTKLIKQATNKLEGAFNNGPFPNKNTVENMDKFIGYPIEQIFELPFKIGGFLGAKAGEFAETIGMHQNTSDAIGVGTFLSTTFTLYFMAVKGIYYLIK